MLKEYNINEFAAPQYSSRLFQLYLAFNGKVKYFYKSNQTLNNSLTIQITKNI